MIDVYSTPIPLTVQLPADLVAELQLLAGEQGQSVDEIIREACLDYVEPFIWASAFKEREQKQADGLGANNGMEMRITPSSQGKENQA